MKDLDLKSGISFKVAAIKLTCGHCGGQEFAHSESFAAVAGMFSARAAAKPGCLEVFSCVRCGWVAMFQSKLAEMGEILKCLECGADIAADSDTCTSCGWTYK